MWSSVRKILERHPITASAPCRIDSGGTWDIRAMALPLRHVKPVTLNVALNLRTRVKLSPLEDGWVEVASKGFPRTETRRIEDAPLDGPFGLFFGALSFFGFSGLSVSILSDSPVKSALGGSSTALVALIKALSKLSRLMGRGSLPAREILHLAYTLEDGLSSGFCGVQDQAAAVYGGVSLWSWRFEDRASFFQRKVILDAAGQKELSKRIIVAFSGRSHVSVRINRSWVHDFLSGRSRSGWIRANSLIRPLAEALGEKDWNRAAAFMRKEMAVRRELTPGALIPATERLIGEAEAAGCGARFTGAGGGGTVWALGKADKIADLRRTWKSTVALFKGARLLDCAVDPRGVR